MNGNPDNVENPELSNQEEVLRAIATAKNLHTRRLNAYRALLTTPGYTRQMLVRARAELVTAGDNLATELDHYDALGLDPAAPVYVDGRHRVTEVHGIHDQTYQDRLNDFVQEDSFTRSRTNAPSVRTTAQQSRGSITPTEARLLQENLAAQQQIDLRAIRRKRRAQLRQNQVDSWRHEMALRQEQEEREAAHRRRQEQIRQAEEERALEHQREVERREAEREEEARILQQRLREQEIADEIEAEEDELQAAHIRARLNVQAALSEALPGSGGNNRPTGTVRSRGTSIRSYVQSLVAPRQSNLSPVLPPLNDTFTNFTFRSRPINTRSSPPQTPLVNDTPPGPPPCDRSPRSRPTGSVQISPAPLIPPANANEGPEFLNVSKLPPGPATNIQTQGTPNVPLTTEVLDEFFGPRLNNQQTSSPRKSPSVQVLEEDREKIALEEKRLALEKQKFELEKQRVKHSNAVQAEQHQSKLRQDQQKAQAESDQIERRAAALAAEAEAEAKRSAELERQVRLERELKELRVSSERLSDRVQGPITRSNPRTEPAARSDSVSSQVNAQASRAFVSTRAHQSEMPPPVVRSSGSRQSIAPSAAPSQGDYLAVLLQQRVRGDNPKKFSGEPLEFQEFLLDYEESTATIQHDPKLCFNILRGMLTGKALETISAATVADNPREALNEALDILESAFGTARKQCNALIDKLKQRPRITEVTESALLKFHSELLKCYRIMARCNRLVDLEGSEVLQSIFSKLPDYLQNIVEKRSTRPTFKMIMDVVKEEHTWKTGDANYWRENIRKQKREANKQNEKKQEKPAPYSYKINALSHPSENFQKVPACLCAPPTFHSCVADCPAYQQTSARKEKMQLLKKLGVCYRCLTFGHMANRCPDGGCQVKNCGRRHHPTLHFAKPEKQQQQQPVQTQPQVAYQTYVQPGVSQYSFAPPGTGHPCFVGQQPYPAPPAVQSRTGPVPQMRFPSPPLVGGAATVPTVQQPAIQSTAATTPASDRLGTQAVPGQSHVVQPAAVVPTGAAAGGGPTAS